MDSQDSPHSPFPGQDLLQWKDTQHHQQRERRRRRWHREETRHTLPRALSQCSPQKTCLIPPAASYSNTCEALSTREAHLGQGGQGFYQRSVTQTPSLWHIPKFQTPRGKQAPSSINHIFYTNSWRTVSHSCQLGNSGDLLEVQLRASLASSFKPAHYSFCTRDLSICWCYGLLLSVCVSSLSLYIHRHICSYIEFYKCIVVSCFGSLISLLTVYLKCYCLVRISSNISWSLTLLHQYSACISAVSFSGRRALNVAWAFASPLCPSAMFWPTSPYLEARRGSSLDGAAPLHPGWCG